jgi:2'-5' RNA ligase
MLMQYLLGIQPPPLLTEMILKFRNTWGIPEMQTHIIVKGQCGLQNKDDLLSEVQRICNTPSNISVRVSGIGRFDNSVLFLKLVSPSLISFHQRLLTELAISTTDQIACSEGAQYNPHITLASTKAATTSILPPIATIAAAAGRWFEDSMPFQPTNLVVYRQVDGELFQPFREVRLT